MTSSLGAGALALFFAASAAVQWNDPDPLRWMALYGVAAAATATSLVRPVPRAVSIGIGAVALAWAALWLPEVLSRAAFTGNEEERELGGLLSVAAAMAWLARRRSRSQRPA